MLAAVVDREAVRRFVQEDLGCGCPVEVFETIARESNPRYPGGTTWRVRLAIGGRLLIYLIDAGSAREAAPRVAAAVAAGLRERGEQGFNRFRLVVAGDANAAVQQGARRAFEAAVGDDPRAHLHLIEPGRVLTL